jgi:copper chaperone CopZ
MRKMIVLVAVVIISVSASAQQFKSADLTASGLTCSMCSKAIYDALKKVDFVKEVKANIKNSTYNIEFNENANVDPDALSKAVTDAGFSVAKLKMLVNFSSQQVKNDSHVTVNGKTFHFMNVGSQTLNGAKQLTLLDKKFISAKEHKKFAAFTKMKCYETGVMESCCEKGQKSERVYHVTI